MIQIIGLIIAVYAITRLWQAPSQAMIMSLVPESDKYWKEIMSGRTTIVVLSVAGGTIIGLLALALLMINVQLSI